MNKISIFMRLLIFAVGTFFIWYNIIKLIKRPVKIPGSPPTKVSKRERKGLVILAIILTFFLFILCFCWPF